jgi:hypothetical protein
MLSQNHFFEQIDKVLLFYIQNMHEAALTYV